MTLKQILERTGKIIVGDVTLMNIESYIIGLKDNNLQERLNAEINKMIS